MLMVSCSSDLKFHECTKYNTVNTYRPFNKPGLIQDISWSGKGTWLALIPQNSCTEIIRTDGAQLFSTIQAVNKPSAIAYQHLTKRYLTIGTNSGCVLIYDIKNNRVAKNFITSGPSISTLTWNSSDLYLAFANKEGKVTLCNNKINKITKVLSMPHSKTVSSIKFHNERKHLLGAGSDEGLIAVWDIIRNDLNLCLKSHYAPVSNVTFDNAKLFISVSLDRSFKCYDLNSGSAVICTMTEEPLSSIDVTPDGFTCYLGSSRGSIYVYDIRQPNKTLWTIKAHSGEIKKIILRPTPAGTYVTQDDVQPLNENSNQYQQELTTSSDSPIGNLTQMINEKLLVKEQKDLNNKTGSTNTTNNTSTSDSFIDFLHLKNDTSKNEEENKENVLQNWNLSTTVTDVPTNLNVASAHESIELRQLLENDSSYQNKNEETLITNNLSTTYSSIPSEKFEHPLRKPTMPIIPPENLNLLLRNMVQNVLSEQMTEFTDNIRRYFLQMNLCLSQHFVEHENFVEQIFKSNLNVSAHVYHLQNQVRLLLEENKLLKSKIIELMNKK